MSKRNPSGPCVFDGCERVNDGARGWCSAHYQRWNRFGDPAIVKSLGRTRRTTEEQIAIYVDKSGGDEGCWPWTGPIDFGGYGCQHLASPVSRLAHKFVFEALVGPVPRGKVLDHICHDPLLCPGGPTCPHRRCVNPGHLIVTTTQENCAPGRSSNVAKAICKGGHALSGHNLIITKVGARLCRECRRVYKREWRARRRLRATIDG